MQAAAALAAELGIEDVVVELGAIPYSLLHHVYRACSMYVTPAYAESFAHPLVEAMATGLPIAAADSAVHREICGDAATYFGRFSPPELADRVCQIVTSGELAKQLCDRGQKGRATFPGRSTSMSCWLWRRIFLLQLGPFGNRRANPHDSPG